MVKENEIEEPTKQCILSPGNWTFSCPAFTNKFKCCEFKWMWGYLKLLRQNKSYRLYLLSQICQHVGDWVVLVTSLATVQFLEPGSLSAIVLLFACSIVPRVFVTPIGGLLADRFDRRLVMMNLDFVACIGVLSYVVASRAENVNYIYIATMIRSAISALGKPAEHAIAPMLVADPEDLLRLVTLNGIASGVANALTGFVVGGGAIPNEDSADVEWCYFIDSATFLLSGLLMWRASGTYPPSRYHQNQLSSITEVHNDVEMGDATSTKNNTKDSEHKTFAARSRSKLLRLFQPIRTAHSMIKEVFSNLWQCRYTGLLFMKASGALTLGADNILNVLYSHVPDDIDGVESDRRLGMIYSSQGIGCVAGLILAATFIADGRKPHTIQLACIFGLIIVILGWVGIVTAPTFDWICFFAFVKWMGGSVTWLYSTLLFQNLSDIALLGRAISIDFALAGLAEGGISYVTGYLVEVVGAGEAEVELLAVGIGGVLLIFWSSYHIFGRGAPRSLYEFDQRPSFVNELNKSSHSSLNTSSHSAVNTSSHSVLNKSSHSTQMNFSGR